MYFCFPWIWQVSSEESQFLTLKMFVYFLLLFFFPGRQQRGGVKRNASRHLCKLFTPLDFLQQDMGCICGGGSPKRLNRRWLPDKLRFGSSVYKSREETPPLFIPPFKQLYKILQACSNTPKIHWTMWSSVDWHFWAFADCFMSLKKDGRSKEVTVPVLKSLLGWLVCLQFCKGKSFWQRNWSHSVFNYFFFFLHSVPIWVVRNSHIPTPFWETVREISRRFVWI